MKFQCSSLYSQEPASVLYPELDKASPSLQPYHILPICLFTKVVQYGAQKIFFLLTKLEAAISWSSVCPSIIIDIKITVTAFVV
jgi:hypothetical protein